MEHALYIWAVIIAVLFGCFTAIVAGEKHRSALGWFTLGALCPPLGLILAIALPPRESLHATNPRRGR